MKNLFTFNTTASAGVLLAIASTVCLSLYPPAAQAKDSSTSTPIKHVVVIYQENVSFDHYFGTYPYAEQNKNGSRYFSKPQDDTPRANTLLSAGLLTQNPNGANPFRIDRSVPNTCDQDHGYSSEQFAFDGGLMDRFLTPLPSGLTVSCNDKVLGPNSVMGFYDGNTVTALWNYAQHYAMSDNFFGTSFGPSTPGALNLAAGNTYAGTVTNGASPVGAIAGGAVTGAVIGDRDPAGDLCSAQGTALIIMSGLNVGDLMNRAGVTWGSFMGGFADCKHVSTSITGHTHTDYIPHHAFFQYWKSTQNPNHVRPTSVAAIGHPGDPANHEYDLTDFYAALEAGNLPAVSFLKARAVEDGHANFSDPLDEQKFLTETINALQNSPEWKETAVIIAYDDSDGWYDHVMGPIVNQSNVAEDSLLGSVANGTNNCGTPKAIDEAATIQNGRCGYGPRLPLLIISPYARQNYIDHRVTDQASITRFIEDNWNLGRIGNGSADAIAGTLNGMFDFSDRASNHKLFLDPMTGQVHQEDPQDSDGR